MKTPALLYYFKFDGSDSINNYNGIINSASSNSQHSFISSPILTDSIKYLQYLGNNCKYEQGLYKNSVTQLCQKQKHSVFYANSLTPITINPPDKQTGWSNDFTIQFQAQFLVSIFHGTNKSSKFFEIKQSNSIYFDIYATNGEMKVIHDSTLAYTQQKLITYYTTNAWVHFAIDQISKINAIRLSYNNIVYIGNFYIMDFFKSSNTITFPAQTATPNFNFKIKQLRIWNSLWRKNNIPTEIQKYYGNYLLTGDQNKLIAYYPLIDYITYDKVTGNLIDSSLLNQIQSVFVPDDEQIYGGQDGTVLVLSGGEVDEEFETFISSSNSSSSSSDIQKFEIGITLTSWLKLYQLNDAGQYCFINHANNFSLCKNASNKRYFIKYYFTQSPFQTNFQFEFDVEAKKWVNLTFSLDKISKNVYLALGSWSKSVIFLQQVKIIEQQIVSNQVSVGYKNAEFILYSRGITLLNSPYQSQNVLHQGIKLDFNNFSVLYVNYLNYYPAYITKEKQQDRSQSVPCQQNSFCINTPSALAFLSSFSLPVPKTVKNFTEYTLLITVYFHSGQFAIPPTDYEFINYCDVASINYTNSNNQFEFSHTDTSNSSFTLVDATPLPTKKWIYLALTYHPSISMRSVIDTIQSNPSSTLAVRSQGPFSCTSEEMKFGTTLQDDYGIVYIKHARMLSTYLTPGEIKSQRNKNFDYTGLVGSLLAGYQLQEGFGSEIFDVTGKKAVDNLEAMTVSWVNDNYIVNRSCKSNQIYADGWCQPGKRVLTTLTSFQGGLVNLQDENFVFSYWCRIGSLSSSSGKIKISAIQDLLNVEVDTLDDGANLSFYLNSFGKSDSIAKLGQQKNKLQKFISVIVSSSSTNQSLNYLAVDNEKIVYTTKFTSFPLTSKKILFLGEASNQLVTFSFGNQNTFHLLSFGLWSSGNIPQKIFQSAGGYLHNREKLILFYSYDHFEKGQIYNFIDDTNFNTVSHNMIETFQNIFRPHQFGGSNVIDADTQKIYSKQRFMRIKTNGIVNLTFKSQNFTSRFTYAFWMQISNTLNQSNNSMTIKFGTSYIVANLSSNLKITYTAADHNLGVMTIPKQKWIFTTISSQYLIRHSITSKAADNSFNFYEQSTLGKNIGGVDLSTVNIENKLQQNLFIGGFYVFPFAMHRQQGENIQSLINYLNRPDITKLADYKLRDSQGSYLSNSLSQTQYGNIDKVEWGVNVYDRIGTTELNCLNSGLLYSSTSNSCVQNNFACTQQLCAQNGTILLCNQGQYYKDGSCITTCDITQLSHASNCHKYICLPFFIQNEQKCSTATQPIILSSTITSQNQLIIKFSQPVTIPTSNLLQGHIVLKISGPRSEYQYKIDQTTCTSLQQQQSLCSQITITLTIYSKIAEGSGVYAQVQLDNSTYFKSINGRILNNNHFIQQLHYQNNPNDQKQIQAIQTFTQAIIPVISTGLVGSVIVQTALDFSLKNAWGLINTAQLLDYIPLINVYLPSNTQIIFGALAFANGDFAFIEEMKTPFDAIIDSNVIESQTQPINQHFRERDYPTSSFYPNFRCLWVKRTEGFYKFSFWVRMYLQIFMDTIFAVILGAYEVISTILTLIQINFNNTSLSLSTVFWILFLLSLLSLGVLLVFFTIKNRRYIKRHHEWKLQEMTNEFVKKRPQKTSTMSLMFYPVFMLERMLFAIILVVFNSSPSTQCFLIFILFIPSGVYVYLTQPFNEKIANLTYIIDRVIILGVVLTMSYLSENGYTLTQDQVSRLGYLIVCLILSSLLMNFIISMTSLFRAICKKCKRGKKSNTIVLQETELSTTVGNLMNKRHIKLSDNSFIEVIREDNDPRVGKQWKKKERRIQTANFGDGGDVGIQTEMNDFEEDSKTDRLHLRKNINEMM